MAIAYLDGSEDKVRLRRQLIEAPQELHADHTGTAQCPVRPGCRAGINSTQRRCIYANTADATTGQQLDRFGTRGRPTLRVTIDGIGNAKRTSHPAFEIRIDMRRLKKHDLARA